MSKKRSSRDQQGKADSDGADRAVDELEAATGSEGGDTDEAAGEVVSKDAGEAAAAHGNDASTAGGDEESAQDAPGKSSEDKADPDKASKDKASKDKASKDKASEDKADSDKSSEDKPGDKVDDKAHHELGDQKDDDTTGDNTGPPGTDPDPVQFGEPAIAAMSASGPTASSAAKSSDESKSGSTSPAASGAVQSVPARGGLPWFGLFNLVLIAALAATAYYYWREQQAIDAAYRAEIVDLQLLIEQVDTAARASRGEFQSSLAPLKSDIGALTGRLDELGLGQGELRDSTSKLYQLFGRDKNDWQLAEVEYLMRVAQHKLILQDDFAGAAITLQASSDLIGETGDPGLLPVRVMISEEIADLRTRRRADLVGMTLVLAQLGRELRVLQPGFAMRIDEAPAEAEVVVETETGSEATLEIPLVESQTVDVWISHFKSLVNSLITVRREATDPTEIEANIVDVAAILEDNLKLARWAVLERDARQYQMLIERSLELFREFYDLDNAANHDFMTQLQELQKMVIHPEKPDITGSLRELQRILSQRDNAPEVPAEPATELSND